MHEYNFIRQQDEEIYATLVGEEEREKKGIELIPSENYVSMAVREAMGMMAFDNLVAHFEQKTPPNLV